MNNPEERLNEVMAAVEILCLDADEFGQTVSQRYHLWVKSDNPDSWLDIAVGQILEVDED